MTPERWRRINEVFALASEEDGDAREEVLALECAGDPELRGEVERLLAHHNTDSNRLDRLQERVASLHRASRQSSLAPEKVLADRFRIVQFLGSGGMGEVYEAFDLELNTRVAFKRLHTELAADAKVLARFKQEIQMARRVTHPNVCRVFDLFRHDEPSGVIHFLTMELIHGETLAARLRRDGPMDTAAALAMLRQMTAGLSAAHAAKVVHRDFKSGNVMIDTAGRVIVTDFGMARDIAPEPGQTLSTSSSVALGTPAYMAPEQIEGKSSTAETDIYALGVVIYEMVTGVLPYADKTPLAVAARKVKEPPRPPREVRPDLPPVWDTVILRCLSRHPQHRFSSALEVMQALDDPTSAQLPRLTRRHWIAAGSLTLTAAAALAWWRLWPKTEPPEAQQFRQSGAEAFLTGSYLKAADRLRRALLHNPQSAATRYWQVHLFSAMGRRDEAEATLQEADRISNNGVAQSPGETPVREAARHALAQRYTDAGRALASVSANESPAHRVFLLCVAARYFRLAGDRIESNRTATLALSIDPKDKFALLESATAPDPADLPAALDRLRQALQEFQLKNDETNSEVQLRLAGLLRAAGREDEALQQAQAALNLARLLQDPERQARALLLLYETGEAQAIARDHGILWLSPPLPFPLR